MSDETKKSVNELRNAIEARWKTNGDQKEPEKTVEQLAAEAYALDRARRAIDPESLRNRISMLHYHITRKDAIIADLLEIVTDAIRFLPDGMRRDEMVRDYDRVRERLAPYAETIIREDV